MTAIKATLFLLACLATLPASADAPNAGASAAKAAAPEAPGPTTSATPVLPLQQIIDRNLAARGGAAAWRHVNSLSMAGTLDAGRERKDGGLVAELAGLGPQQARAAAKARAHKLLDDPGKVPAPKVIQLPYRLEVKRPRKSRFEIDFKGQTAIQTYDGQNGWKVRPYLGRREVERFSAEEAKIAATQQELDGPLLDYAAKGTKVVLVGSEAVEGRATYKLALTYKDGDVRHLWIDAQTFLDTKIEAAPRNWDGKAHSVEMYYRDYKPVDGLMIAHRLETVIQGASFSDNVYIEKVTVNPALPESRFAKPL